MAETISRFGRRQPLRSLTAATKTADHIFVAADADELVVFNKATAIVGTIPLNATVPFEIGTSIELLNIGAGVLTVAITATGTLNKPAASTATVAQHGRVRLLKTGTNTWALNGDLVPV